MPIITSIQTERLSLQIDVLQNIPVNRISLLTGPNGSGKTELLSSAARYLVSERLLRSNIDTRSRVNFFGLCSGVITQTFSPFSRFPSAGGGFRAESFISRSGTDFYTCIGISQTKMYTARTLTRHTLEDALYRLAENESMISTLFQILHNLGYKSNFHLKYRANSAMNKLREIVRTHGADALKSELRRAGYTASRAFESIFSKLASGEGYDLVASAIEISSNFQTSENHYELNFNFYEKNINDFAVFQSFALLRRLGLMKLDGFFLIDEKYSAPMDVTQTSSGQQQMLCSMLSLASALRDDSIVLIDEPELSLHPTWQYLYMDSLFAVLKQFQGCHVLIATHSPLIVQQGSKNGADVIQLNGGSSAPKPNFDLNIDASQSIESTLIDVFKTPVTDSVYLANEVLSAVVSAEEDSINLGRSLDSLYALLEIYSNSTNGDRKSVELIKQAIDCLS